MSEKVDADREREAANGSGKSAASQLPEERDQESERAFASFREPKSGKSGSRARREKKEVREKWNDFAKGGPDDGQAGPSMRDCLGRATRRMPKRAESGWRRFYRSMDDGECVRQFRQRMIQAKAEGE